MSDLRIAAQQALEALDAIAWSRNPTWQSQRAKIEVDVLRAALAQQAEPVDVGLLEYRGNSVAFIHQKMTAYQAGIDAAWDAFRAKGLHPDGKTPLANMIAKYTAPPQRQPVVVSVDELANHIRVVDGNHSLGAGALAEKIVEFLIERAHGIKE